MSHIRRPVPRKPSAAKPSANAWAAAGQGIDADVLPPVAEEEHAHNDALKQRVIEEFESSLRGREGIGDEDLQPLLDAFRTAVEEASIDASFTPLDPEEVALTLNGLVDQGVLQEEDRNAIARQFESALDPLDNADLQIALEFAQRVERDGEAEARKWLKTQQNESGQDAQPNPATPSAPASDETITKSRSRRLRAPPGR
ncbi:MAG: hypothetical protein GX761_10705 [Gammaproteobacteria bacterium]|uniref:hypothetical protein n=1 Tax=Luteimonas sp. JM171 TaxID=1896164 RepID=UPI0012FA3C1B|nr:hypothetical protein [Luteimonas sp. JM171]NLC61733.1 hypothetical protein [Gammaproteobacteria bacterium]